MLGLRDTFRDKEDGGRKAAVKGREGMVLKDPRPGAYGLGAGCLL